MTAAPSTTCWECDGSGQEEDVTDYTSTVNCYRCRGLGKIKHDVEIVSSFTEGGWTAQCSCGWVGPKHEHPDDASADTAQHYVEVAERQPSCGQCRDAPHGICASCLGHVG